MFDYTNTIPEEIIHDSHAVKCIVSIHLIVGVTSYSWNCRGGSYFRM